MIVKNGYVWILYSRFILLKSNVVMILVCDFVAPSLVEAIDWFSLGLICFEQFCWFELTKSIRFVFVLILIVSYLYRRFLCWNLSTVMFWFGMISLWLDVISSDLVLMIWFWNDFVGLNWYDPLNVLCVIISDWVDKYDVI